MARKETLIQLLLVLLVSTGTTLPWLGLSDFYSRGEPREALVAQDMIASGEVVLPSGYGEGIPSKPPFDHWLIALFSLNEGAVSEFTSRLPSALASILFSAGFYLVVSKRTNAKQGLLSTLFLLTTFEWGRSASSCRVDMVHAAALAGALLVGYVWIEEGRQRHSLWMLLLLIAAFLSKGPVGIVLPAFILLLALLLRGLSIKETLYSSSRIFVPAILVGSVWYLLAYLRGGEAFWSKVFYENFARFASTMHDSPHEHGVLYLIGMSFAGLMPWSLIAAPTVVPAFLARIRERNLREQIEKWGSFERFCLLASLCIFFFYSIPSSKRPVYVLAAYPFISVLIARAVMRASAKAREVALRLHLCVCSLSLLLIGALIIAIGAAYLVGPILPDSCQLQVEEIKTVARALFTAGPIVGSLLLLTPLVLAARAILKRSSLTVNEQLAAVYVSVFLALNGAVLPAVSQYLSDRSLALTLSKEGFSEERLFSYGHEFYGLSFYLKKNIFPLISLESLTPGDVVIVKTKALARFIEGLPRALSHETLATKSRALTPDSAVSVVRVEAVNSSSPAA